MLVPFPGWVQELSWPFCRGEWQGEGPAASAEAAFLLFVFSQCFSFGE